MRRGRGRDYIGFFFSGFSTYCGVVGGDIEQNLGGASAGDVSVAVPHTRDQVGLTPDGEREDTRRSETQTRLHAKRVFLPLPVIHPSSGPQSELLGQLGRPSAAGVHPQPGCALRL